MGAGVLDSENNGRIRWQPTPDREIELSQTNRGVGGVYVGVVPRVQSKLSRALRTPWEEAPARSPNPRKCGDEESYGKV